MIKQTCQDNNVNDQKTYLLIFSKLSQKWELVFERLLL